MDLATPSPAARAPVARHGWWLMPLGLGGGASAATFMSSDRISMAVVGFAATAASTVCVGLYVRTRARLDRAKTREEAERAQYSEQARQWQHRLAELQNGLASERAAAEARFGEQAQTYEARITESVRAHESRLAEQTGTHEAQLAEQAAAWQQRLEDHLAAVALLNERDLPEAIARLRAGEAIDDILPTVEQRAMAGDELRVGLVKVLRTALMGVEAELDRSTSAEQAVIGIGSRIHVLTSMLRGRLHEMQGEHGRQPAVAQGLMELDQAIGPADCLAASIGVLGGSARPGRQWQEPQRLLSVVRGGIGWVKDFDRVELRQLPELGVDGGLVDHLALILAHLLDNAARYSPPTEPVVVSGKEVPNGVGIEIQDSGKGLSEEKKREVANALAGSMPGAGLGGVSEDANIGLRVVGILARRYGIRVTFADSPWLGTSVVVVVPHKYFRPLPTVSPAVMPAPVEPQAPSSTPAPGTVAPPVHEEEPARPEANGGGSGETTPGGLPRRRSRREASSSGTIPEARSAPSAFGAVPPDASFAGLAAFAAAGRDTGERTGGQTTDDSDGRDTTGDASTEHRTEESD
ncbi:ATP-binding protein [Streptomyces sp. NPDC020403]|uniref:ATP-binding protein n=1 Tax=unclassified Streptomyces TaxID=2593676 RepID=UPI0033DFCD61